MTNPLGTDLSTARGLGSETVSGLALLAQSLARRLRTRRGALFHDPTYGSYLPEYLGESFEDGGQEAAVICELDLEEDPRVRTAEVTVETVTPEGVTLRAEIDSIAGPITLIVEAAAAGGLYPAALEVTPDGVG
ncbi:hypothetical protein [Deinococcus sp. 6GRE01]|uniref:hypothetical protein n=1 Tax=Deinococcus sp. 6GRE01 TaxID=2745873 RepID=UPI001E644D37|nr:hypothetical protein [Deinococcus sp. 6GRE01]MCD0156005.1 hypothetical protein [Deinococcus sp. 6GRE01]